MNEFLIKDNQLITTVLIGVLLFLLMGVALLLFFFFSRKKIVEKELEKKKLEIGHQKQIIQSIIVTQEKERKRIAQDLHDDISSRLNVINLNANLLKDGKLSDTEYISVNNAILEATDKTLESARKIAHNLLPPILDKFGLKDALEELADSFNNSRKITIHYQIKYTKGYLAPKKELHLFRVVQELINNSVRHGKATNTTLTITCKEHNLIFKYLDDGIGFDASNHTYRNGLGLKNIESRLQLLKGIYTIESAPGKGFKIFITIKKP